MYNQSGKIVLVLVLLILALSIITYFFLPVFKQREYTELTPSPFSSYARSEEVTRDYYSQNLKISVQIPENAEIEEKFTDIIISLENGKVFQTRVGTNFATSREYFADLKEKNNLSPKTYNEIVLNGRDVVLAILEDPNDRTKNQKTYFLYNDNAIYTFYSSDEALYPVLDQIVGSFEYKP